MFCEECGGKNEQDHVFCIHCGVVIPQHTVTANPEDKRPSMSAAHDLADRVERSSARLEVSIITVGAVMALFAAVFIFSGAIPASLPSLLLLFLPLILGMVVFLARVEKPVSWVKDLHSWTARKRDADTGKSGILHRWLLGPLVFGLSKATQWPERVKDPYLRSAIQISVSLYFIGVMYFSMSIFIVIVILGIAFWTTAYALDWDGGSATATSCSKRTEGRDIQGSAVLKCENCSDYGKQDWSVKFECSLGRPTPDLGDTAACRS